MNVVVCTTQRFRRPLGVLDCIPRGYEGRLYWHWILDTMFKNTVTQGESFKEAWCEALWGRTEKLRDTVISGCLVCGLGNTYHLGSDIQSSSGIELRKLATSREVQRQMGPLGISMCEGCLIIQEPRCSTVTYTWLRYDSRTMFTTGWLYQAMPQWLGILSPQGAWNWGCNPGFSTSYTSDPVWTLPILGAHLFLLIMWELDRIPSKASSIHVSCYQWHQVLGCL